MKNLKIQLMLIIVFVNFASCADFLEETPTTQLDGSKIYNTEVSALSALAGCYANMANAYGYHFYHVHTVSSGLGVSLKAIDLALTSMNIATNDTHVNNMYSAFYKVINSANDILEGVENAQLEEGTIKNKILGEAYLARAISYFNLVRSFGKVPLVTNVITSYEGTGMPRSEVKDVYRLIITDLTKAFELLPEPGDQDMGRPHKYAAKAVLAKVYVTMAGTDDTSEYWQTAYDAALEVKKNGEYSLVRPFSNLFGRTNNNNKESIVEIQFNSAIRSNEITTATIVKGWQEMTNVTSVSLWGKDRPTKYAFDRIDNNDPRKDVTFIHTSYTNILENDKLTLLYPSKKNDIPKSVFKKGDSEYASWKKYADPGYTSASSCNYVYMRYADLVLLLAEAANELGKKEDAVNYLNEILERARDVNGNGNIEEEEVYPLAISSSDYDRVSLRDRIINERLTELSGEGDEWFTIRRKGATFLKSIMEEHNNVLNEVYPNGLAGTTYVYKFDTSDEDVRRNLLLPFPMDEIVRNGAINEDEQNYGY